MEYLPGRYLNVVRFGTVPTWHSLHPPDLPLPSWSAEQLVVLIHFFRFFRPSLFITYSVRRVDSAVLTSPPLLIRCALSFSTHPLAPPPTPSTSPLVPNSAYHVSCMPGYTPVSPCDPAGVSQHENVSPI